MAGKVFKRESDGVWRGYVIVGHRPDGKAIRKYSKGSLDKGMAQAELDKLKHDVGAGIVIRDNMTVAELLTLFRVHKEATLEKGGRGIEGIRLSITHIEPLIGSTKLSNLTPSVIERMMARIVREKQTPYTALRARETMRAAWNWARRERIVAGDNPAADADTSIARYQPKERRTLPLEDAKRVLEIDHPLRALWAMGLTTGMRPGELIALTWNDIDMDRLMVTVPGTKTPASRATIVIAPFVAAMLREHQRASGRVGGALVWTTRTGQKYYVRNLRRLWENMLRRERPPIPHVDFYHASRHTCGELLNAMGVPMHIIQAMLRHTQITTTRGIYAPPTVADMRVAAEAMQRLLGD